MAPRVSIVIPAYNEGDSIFLALDRIAESVKSEFECIVVVDDENDSTCAAVKLQNKNDGRFKLEINRLGRGPANAIKHGIEVCNSGTVVVTMADGSDDPQLIDPLVRLIERGVVVAAASRYMSGGQQVGAKGIKSSFSKLAGRSLYFLARVGTHDATNSFKAYNTKFVRQAGISSKHGFELGIEMVAKARRLRLPIAELPTIWLERNSGESNFKLTKWIPHYLSWYFFAFGKSRDFDELAIDSIKASKLKAIFIKDK
ncbi:MAG: glycosyltransferase family 2 protein [Actinobacteria bacterium]|nr:glycosyltransferase family 2 protein [Actinomycetota bacterium]